MPRPLPVLVLAANPSAALARADRPATSGGQGIAEVWSEVDALAREAARRSLTIARVPDRRAAALAAALLACAAAAGAQPGPATRVVVLGPVEVELLVAGSAGPTVVFLGGPGVPAADWAPLLDRVAACVRAVAVSRPGAGGSVPAPDAPVDASATAGLIYGALAVAGFRPPWAVVGHALGGLYAQAFFRGFPDAATGLVLVDAVMPNAPDGLLAPSVSPAEGTPAFWEAAGAPAAKRAVAALPPPPALPVVVLTAGDHGESPAREALWRRVQSRGAAAFPRGGQIIVEGSGPAIQHDAPDAVVAAIAQLLPDRHDCLADG